MRVRSMRLPQGTQWHTNAWPILASGCGATLTAHEKTITWLADQIGGNPTMVIKWRAGVELRTRGPQKHV